MVGLPTRDAPIDSRSASKWSKLGIYLVKWVDSDGQKGVYIDIIQRRGTVIANNVPETRNKLVSMLCMGCGRHTSASELNLRQVGVRAGVPRRLFFLTPTFRREKGWMYYSVA